MVGIDDPAFVQGLEAGGIGSFDDFQLPRSSVWDDRRHPLAPVAAIGKDAFDEGKQPTGLVQQRKGTITILDISEVHNDVQHETRRVDRNFYRPWRSDYR